MIIPRSKRKSCEPSCIYRCVLQLMGIDSSVYVFLSGIFISLSTNLLTSVCFVSVDICRDSYFIVIIATSLISGAMFIMIATRLAPIQERMRDILKEFKNQDKKEGDPLQIHRKIKTLCDYTKKNALKWIVLYCILIISTISAIVLTLIKIIFLR